MGTGFDSAGGYLGVRSVVRGRYWYLLEVGKRVFGVGVRVVTFVVFFGKTNP